VKDKKGLHKIIKRKGLENKIKFEELEYPKSRHVRKHDQVKQI
jgi:ssDNA-binding Zn-finger/Zn-ribbon topoisomerase 1